MDDFVDDVVHPPNKRLASYLKQARDRLIQTGTRNRLVHTARFGKRGKYIDIVDERSDDIFQIIVRDGKRMRFDHDPDVLEEGADGEPLLEGGTRSYKGEERFTDDLLQTQLGQDRLQKKLLGLAREAKTLEEEQGINALYLALGFLRWFEDENSDVPREAPLVLVPVSLVRNNRTSRYELEARGEDIATNEPLKRRLADDFGIRLPDIDEGEEWLPSDYFDAVRDCISGRSGWSIDVDGIQLGFFSFAKLLMVRDLEVENWPDGGLVGHPIIAGLLQDGFSDEHDDFEAAEDLDCLFAPADLIQVLDADASQTLVIEAVRRGRNLVVKGPPGTGKSQTITNMIAAAVYDGKTVLFIAEKMAALTVVHSRLVDAGLQSVCLELHSRYANKRTMAQELASTLDSAATFQSAEDDAIELQRMRDQLNGLSSVMHTPIGETDVTPYRAVSTLIRLREEGFGPVDHEIANVGNWSRKDLAEALTVAKELEDLSRKAGPRDQHPFVGVRRTDLLPPDIQRLQARLADILTDVAKTARQAHAVLANAGGSVEPGTSMCRRLAELLHHVSELSPEAVPFAAAIARNAALEPALRLADAGHALVRHNSIAETKFKAAALRAPIDHLRPMLAAGNSIFGRFGRKYRTASSELQSLTSDQLPKRPTERMALLDELFEWQQANRHIEQIGPIGTKLLGDHWRGSATDFAALADAAKWMQRLMTVGIELDAQKAVALRKYDVGQLRGLGDELTQKAARIEAEINAISELLNLDFRKAVGKESVDQVSLKTLHDKLSAWLENIDRLDEWSQLSSMHDRLAEIAGDEFVSAFATGRLPAEQIEPTIRFVHAEALYKRFAQDHGWATRLTAEQKSGLVGSFREREKRRRQNISKAIHSEHVGRIPRGGMGAMGFIRGEIARRRGHKPIRTVMKNAGQVVQQIKPVFLMSPISVAQYLPPGSLEFDLLVIDEASQIRPEDALCAIARAKQLVVVGDRKQLPPTSFFDRIVTDENDEEAEGDEAEADVPAATSATELESILTLCEARGLGTRMLEWHYRSRHPSLIEVSNERFYEGKLVLFPSPATDKDKDGLTMTRVAGAYDRGGKRHNVIEAEAVARAVAAHAKNYTDRSLGVVTFSTPQRDQITYWLDKLRQDDQALDEFMREGRKEEFFVKNIENVQGDERDVIFISVGYGPRVAGHRLDSMAFGPVSSEGGERRLNVLFTRARFKTEVFVSFSPGDIDISRTKNEGARVLKQFLHAAETGITHQPAILDEDPDSDFEVSVARAIRSLGYDVDHQIGSAGFKIDLAVRHPDDRGRYMLAVECDGATYHSALWARERDRQRQEVLEGLGWRFHRVWSTDWFHRRDAEFRRLENAIEDARKPRHEERAPQPDLFPPAADGESASTTVEDSPAELPDYEVAHFSVGTTQEPHEVPVRKMAETVKKIIDVEGPVHQDEVARRVAALYGKQRAGSRISDHIVTTLHHLKSVDQTIISSDGFWLTETQQASPPLRNRSRASWGSLKRADMIPPIEIEAAIEQVLKDNGAIAQDDIPRAVALLFGFQRTGPEFRPAVEPIVTAMLGSGKAVVTDAGIALPS